MSKNTKSTFNKSQNYETRRRGSINWEKVRHAYVYGDLIHDLERHSVRHITLAEIAKQYDINPNNLAVKAARERWNDQRVAYRQKVNDLHDREIDIQSIRKSAMFDGDSINRLELFAQIFDEWLSTYAPDIPMSQAEKNAYMQLCLDENINSEDESDEDSAVSDEGKLNGETYMVNTSTELGDVSPYMDEEIIEKCKPNIKELNMAIDVMSKMHKLSRDIMGEPVNYEQYYADKAKESKRLADKGKAVSKNDIRDLIANIRGATSMAGGVTLDVHAEEVRDITLDVKDVTDE